MSLQHNQMWQDLRKGTGLILHSNWNKTLVRRSKIAAKSPSRLCKYDSKTIEWKQNGLETVVKLIDAKSLWRRFENGWKTHENRSFFYRLHFRIEAFFRILIYFFYFSKSELSLFRKLSHSITEIKLFLHIYNFSKLHFYLIVHVFTRFN